MPPYGLEREPEILEAPEDDRPAVDEHVVVAGCPEEPSSRTPPCAATSCRPVEREPKADKLLRAPTAHRLAQTALCME